MHIEVEKTFSQTSLFRIDISPYYWIDPPILYLSWSVVRLHGIIHFPGTQFISFGNKLWQYFHYFRPGMTNIDCSYFFSFSRAAEEVFVKERDQTEPGEEWEKICRLCEFNPKNSKNVKDVSRMRSILLQLKQTPLVR